MKKRAISPNDIETGAYDYTVELARGGSHIASTLTPATRHAAVEEVLTGFTGLYGADKAPLFCQLLIQNLDKRKCPEGAQAVRDCRWNVQPPQPKLDKTLKNGRRR